MDELRAKEAEELGKRHRQQALNKPKLGKLTEEEKQRKKPVPPEYLVDALQDPVHKDIGKSRAVKLASRTTDYKEYVEDTKQLLNEVYNALFVDINALPDEVAYSLIKNVREMVGEAIDDCKKREKELN